MKRILVIAATLFAACSAMADLVATSGENERRLMPGPCVHAGILGMLKPEHRKQFKKGQAYVQGHLFYACWIDTGEGAYFVLYEDGDGKAYSVTSFTDKPGV
jgi:hypothetical protein